MTATTVDRQTPQRASVEFNFPVAASTKLLAGTIACVNASGFLVPGSTATTLKAVGIAQETVDNTAGVNGALSCNVRRGGFKLDNSASGDLIALSDYGAQCFIVDNQTVAKTNGSSTRSVAGIVRDVASDGSVWVEF